MAILNGSATISGSGQLVNALSAFSSDFSIDFQATGVVTSVIPAILGIPFLLWAGNGAYNALTNLLSTELNALSSSAGNVLTAPGPVQQNTASLMYSDLEFVSGGNYTPVASGYLEIWFLISTNNGTNYEDGSAVISPSRPADARISIRAGTGIQPRAIVRGIPVPPSFYRVVVRNQTGATLPAAGNLLRGAFYTETIGLPIRTSPFSLEFSVEFGTGP